MQLYFFSCVSTLLYTTNKHDRLLIKSWGGGAHIQVFSDIFILHKKVTRKHFGHAPKKTTQSQYRGTSPD